MSSVPVAFFQFDARETDRVANLDRVASAIEEARREGARLLVLPELWASGYDLAAACTEGGWEREISAVAELSRIHDLAVVGSYLESDDDSCSTPANCAIAHESGVERQRYRKVHLFGPLGEDQHLRSGATLPEIFDLSSLRVAMTVCYDLRFPELFRPLAIGGAELITVSAQWPVARIHHWRTLLIARAIESQCYVIGVNRSGRFGAIEFGGQSMVVSPTGEILADAGEEPGVHCADVDAGVVRSIRTDFPVLLDRRTDLYS